MKAEAEVQRRLEAGISDSVEDLNGGVNGGAAPSFDQTLVGKRLEVLWPYTDKDSGERVLIWASGCVVRVADGLSDRRSARAKTVLPAGMVLWAWDADPEFDEPAGEKWLALLPKKTSGISSSSTRGAMIHTNSAATLLLSVTRGAQMHAPWIVTHEDVYLGKSRKYVGTVWHVLVASVGSQCMCATPHRLPHPPMCFVCV